MYKRQTEIIATSHYNKDKYDLNKENRKIIVDLINQKLAEKQINVKIHVGAEIFIYPEMVSDIINGEVPTLGESRYVLFELPFVGKVIYLDNIIAVSYTHLKLSISKYSNRTNVILRVRRPR